MFESIMNFFKKLSKKEKKAKESSSTAKERLHLVLMQDRANVSADFLELMRQEIIEVIKKYIDIDEKAIDVKLTNKTNEDGTIGAPALYANIPIITIKNEARKVENVHAKEQKEDDEKPLEEKTEKVDEAKEEKQEAKPIQENEQEQSNSSNEETKEEKVEVKEEVNNKEQTQEEANKKEQEETKKQETVANS